MYFQNDVFSHYYTDYSFELYKTSLIVITISIER